jgi:threonylcarbamoyladenosine tRNA methylthiotransferase MtaB
MMNVRLDFVGCRLNQSEIEAMGRELAARGHCIVGEGEQADVVILNTCAVTHEAARKSRHRLRQLGREHPGARLVATGCYAQLAPGKVGYLPGVTVIGNFQKDQIVPLVAGDALRFEKETPEHAAPRPGTFGRTRAFVKVQDGCDNRCTFCITTIARGPGRSRPLDEVVREAQSLESLGYNEIVLTGVHLGAYGRERGEADGLARLVRALLDRTHVPRLRLSSLEPWDLRPDFFDLWSDERLCPHLHLPLQSGCDAALRRMARRTTQAGFAALVDAARARIPDLALTTDIMVGFPGESEAEFEESARFVGAMGFAKLHVFRYSPRPSTAAARMADQVSEEVKQVRSARMRALSDEGGRAFRRCYLGRAALVLWESAHTSKAGFEWAGLTPNYIRVRAASPRHLANTITPALLTGVTPDGMCAELPA